MLLVSDAAERFGRSFHCLCWAGEKSGQAFAACSLLYVCFWDPDRSCASLAKRGVEWADVLIALPTTMQSFDRAICTFSYTSIRSSKTSFSSLVTAGAYCRDPCTKKASNNQDVRVADRTYILSVSCVILQLRVWSFL